MPTPAVRQGGVRAQKGKLILGPKMVASLFDEIFDAILKKTKEVLEEEPGISAVYMVGGFSSNPLLQERVTSCVRQLCLDAKVVFPFRPGLAIVSSNIDVIYHRPTISSHFDR